MRKKGVFHMKTRNFFYIATFLVFLIIIIIFSACKEEEEKEIKTEVKSGGTLIVNTGTLYNQYCYIYVYFDEIEVSRVLLYENDSTTVTYTKDVAWKVIYGINPNGAQYNNGTFVGLLRWGETVICNIPFK